MTLFYIIRHGETDYNRDGRYQGQSDVPLNDDGRRQSQALASRMAGVALDQIYASPLGRAHETARAMAAGRQISLDDRLLEVNVGQVVGMSTAKIAGAYPEFAAAYRRDPDRTPFPGGESASDVQVRSLEAIGEIHQRFPHGRVALITHGGVIKTIVMHVLGMPLSDRNRIVLNNCSITIVEWGARRQRLWSLNEMGHLDQEPQEIKADF